MLKKNYLRNFLISFLLVMATSCDKQLLPANDTSIGIGDYDLSSYKAPEMYTVPFKTIGDYFSVYNGKEYKKFFLKGMNLAVALPGTRAGELEISTKQYLDWFQRMADIGINMIRVYTLHRPPFYDAVRIYNLSHPDKPLYIMHGIWFDEDEEVSDMYERSKNFEDGIKEVIDASHGNIVIPNRYGRASGTYRTDISPWVIGWLVGREILFNEIQATNQDFPYKTAYNGKYLNISSGTPSEIWVTEHLDLALSYEAEKYKVTRPVGLSSWPTLDPIEHPTEPDKKHEDLVQVDITKIDYKNAKGGLFVSYHAYPYYPDYIIDDPEYRKATDSYGENSYLGYIRDLKKHYQGMPMLIGEYGITSSWGMGHVASNGMHHGHHDEEEQGNYDVRLLNNIYDTKAAGCALFVWIDEWWKSTWVIASRAIPRDRYELWHNLGSPEQNYGLIAFEPIIPPYSKLGAANQSGQRVQEVQAVADAEFFHLKIKLNSALADGEVMNIGYDTYSDELGEVILPNKVKTTRRNELALEITGGSKEADLKVTNAYDLENIDNPDLAVGQFFHSTATEGGPWNLIRWKVNGAYYNNDLSQYFEAKYFYPGVLRARKGSDKETSLDAVVTDGNNIDVRIPWLFLNFTDPSTRSVMNDDRSTPLRETAVSDGIGVSISIGGDLYETERYKWSTWDKAPPYRQREKKSMAIFEKGLKAIPTDIQ
jgi:hypothetical protein